MTILFAHWALPIVHAGAGQLPDSKGPNSAVERRQRHPCWHVCGFRPELLVLTDYWLAIVLYAGKIRLLASLLSQRAASSNRTLRGHVLAKMPDVFWVRFLAIRGNAQQTGGPNTRRDCLARRISVHVLHHRSANRSARDVWQVGTARLRI